MASLSLSQCVPLDTSPKPLSSRYLFGLVNISKNYANSIHFVIPTSPNHGNCVFVLVNQKVFGTDCCQSDIAILMLHCNTI